LLRTYSEHPESDSWTQASGSKQDTEDPAELLSPSGQLWHDVAPGVGLKVPGAQLVHAVRLLSLYFPGTHSSHVSSLVAARPLVLFPEAHASQSPLPVGE
jgi:hypothetical protein